MKSFIRMSDSQFFKTFGVEKSRAKEIMMSEIDVYKNNLYLRGVQRQILNTLKLNQKDNKDFVEEIERVIKMIDAFTG